MEKQFISWRRVSTAKQRGSHLGLEAQKSIIDFFVEREKGKLIADYEECHSGTDLAGCTELKKAKAHCKKTGATLIIAKTDRCRDTIEALQLYEEMNGKIYFCDLPHTDKFTLTLFFSLAEREAMIVSLRTKQALAALKARGDVKLGAANDNYNISKESLHRRGKRAGETRTRRALESRDVVALIRIMKTVFPKCAETPENEWRTSFISTRRDERHKVLTMMRDYAMIDESGKLFAKWDFSDFDAHGIQQKLFSKMQSIIKMLTY